MQYFGSLYHRSEKKPNYTALFNTLQTYQQTLIIPEPVLYNGVNVQLERYRTPEIDLKTGDRLTVFHSIAAGETLWKGDLGFFQHQDAPYQIGIDPVIWAALHIGRFPAKLIKAETGEVIDGTLSDGIDRPKDFFHLHDFKNNSYDSIHGYNEGDTLEIFSSVTEGKVLWQGEVEVKNKPVVRVHWPMSSQEIDSLKNTGVSIEKHKAHHLSCTVNRLIAPSMTDFQNYNMRRLPVMLERN